jgi:electron transfer flavoprotein beta subunit
LKIAVCIKQVVDTSMPIDIASGGARLAEEDLCYMVNPADECATEEALHIKESRPETEVILLSLGPPRVERAMRHCLAMGADRAIRLWDSAFSNIDAFVRARILAQAISNLGADLILCGSRSQDTDEGQTPGIMADLLNLPQVTAVTKLQLSPDFSYANLEHKLDRGDRELVECPLPALLSLEAGINQPRYSALPEFMQALLFPIQILGMSELGLSYNDVGPNASMTSLVRFSVPRPRTKKKLVIEGSLSPEERLRMLSTGGISEKKSDLWQGSAKDLAKRFADLLRKEGYV